MKTKQSNWMALSVVAAACIAGSYLLADPCYNAQADDKGFCRNLLGRQGIDIPAGPNGCTLADSLQDDFVLSNMYQVDSYSGYDLAEASPCRVAYDCGGTITLVYADVTQGTTLSGPWGVAVHSGGAPPGTTCPN